jgi:membrane protein DedA with SNARE-associated domain
VLAPLHAWLQDHLYAVVLLGAVADAVGIPIPGRILLITAGSFSGAAATGGGSPLLVVALATVGTVGGDHLWYVLGRVRGRRLFDLYCRLFRLSERKVRTADRLLARFGGVTLIVARLAATFRLVLVPLAVSRGMSYPRFLAFEFVGALLWSAGFVFLGWLAGAAGGQSGVAVTVALVGGLVVASVGLGLYVRRRFLRRVSLS